MLEADAIELGSGAALQLGPPPRGVPTLLSEIEAQSTIDRVLPNMDGEAEMLLLHDGAIVRIPPEIRDEAAQWLTPGSAVRANGEGGVYGGIKSMHATSLSVAGRQFASDPRPAPLPPPGPGLIP
jgi:hypothetical protein